MDNDGYPRCPSKGLCALHKISSRTHCSKFRKYAQERSRRLTAARNGAQAPSCFLRPSRPNSSGHGLDSRRGSTQRRLSSSWHQRIRNTLASDGMSWDRRRWSLPSRKFRDMPGHRVSRTVNPSDERHLLRPTLQRRDSGESIQEPDRRRCRQGGHFSRAGRARLRR
jgi:hypothetical protein